MKRAVVCGAGGFIAGHLVRRLKREGHWVRGVDCRHPEFSDSEADEFVLLDLRHPLDCAEVLSLPGGTPDEVYQLAADMGGMGYIHSAECEIMHNNALINIHMAQAAAKAAVPRYFFASSVCVYRDMRPGEPELIEEDAYPALPDNEYGWEKLYAERTVMAFGRRHGMTVRIGRFQNCYGPGGAWTGGREKAPAALCRKLAEAADEGVVEVWGDGSAVRSYTYVDDIVDGIRLLMQSGLEGPCNIGSPEYVTVDELAAAVARAAGKRVRLVHVNGPVGVRSRNFSIRRMASIGWQAQWSLQRGIAETYPWVDAQAKNRRRELTP
ncbi:MAG: NAD-dependent epimerase/dehydratase family protein [Candidatus Hydrogenedentes bacterium]|nr:NAD-dependent epimerase/dehydratase family protein [Candidatus Hydrogenedentota bacterium]